jgi:hypothetical protein
MKRSLAALLILVLPAFAGDRLLITDVRVEEGQEAPRISVLLEHGRIAVIYSDRSASVPGVRTYAGEGRWLTPAFIDAWTADGVDAPAIVTDRDRKPDVSAEIMPAMRSANRKGIRAGFSVASALAWGSDELAGIRKRGFGTLHVVSGGELLGGKTAVVSAADAAARDQVIAEGVFQSAAFRASGTGYPSTLMGYHAQLRQFFLDARWGAELRARWEDGRSGPRPAFDEDLREGELILAGERRLLCEAESDDDILRWLRLVDEWGERGWQVEIAIVGGREAWLVADVLRERAIPVFLTLAWGDEVEDPDEDEESDEADEEEEEGESGEAGASGGEDSGEDESDAPLEDDGGADLGASEEGGGVQESDAVDETEEEDPKEKEISWEYTEPLAVRRERRARWEEGRDCAIRLHEAGVVFAFGSGKDSSKKMLGRVRELVDGGLPAEVALTALTSGAASLLDLGGRIGAVEEGYVANLAIWAGDPMAKKPRLAAVIVDGVIEEFDLEEEDEGEAPEEGIEIEGGWTFEYTDEKAGSTSMELEMDEEGVVTGELTVKNSFMEKPQTESVSGRLSGNVLTLSAEFNIEGFVVEIEFEGKVTGTAYKGDAIWTFSGGSQETRFTAERSPEGRRGVQR